MSNVSSGVDLWQQARTKISGGTGLLSKRAERFDPQEWPAYFSRCKGSEVWDLEGRKYVDFAGGVGAILLGYSDDDVNAAVKQRVDAGNYCTLVSPDEVKLADELLGLHPWAARVRFARGGGEGMGIAVRIARAATGKSGVAFCGYHGWQDWYLAANLGDDAALDGHLLPGLQPLGVPRELAGTARGFRYNDLASFEEALGLLEGNVAAVVMEPMRNQFPEPGFFETIARRCREIGAVLVIDEVTSGFRFGWPGAHARFGLEPDIAVYAKALSNGFPCAAVVGRESVMDAANDSFISSSYWTDGVGTAAALACLTKMRSIDIFNEVWERGEKLKISLQQIGERHPSCKLMLGGMPSSQSVGFDLGDDRQAAGLLFTRKMLRRGYMIGGQTYVMHTHDDGIIGGFLENMEAVLGEIEGSIEAGTLRQEVGLGEFNPGFQRLN